jgi:dolichol-phosphate mannosyltransferase
MKLVIVIPTYNERANIGPLLGALSAVRTQLRHRFEVLIVDDGSPDGTADAVRALQGEHAWLHLLAGHRKAGLGVAYARGIAHAIRSLDAELLGQMDCDLSHRPGDLPRLIAAIEAGADIAIGSRYVDGGRLPGSWPWRRRAISGLANLAARYLVGLGPIRDCTAGFRLLRKRCFEHATLPAPAAPPAGYVFLVWLLEHACRRGARVTEVPVEYVERSEGHSKLRLADIAEFAVYALAGPWRRMKGN